MNKEEVLNILKDHICDSCRHLRIEIDISKTTVDGWLPSWAWASESCDSTKPATRLILCGLFSRPLPEIRTCNSWKERFEEGYLYSPYVTETNNAESSK